MPTGRHPSVPGRTVTFRDGTTVSAVRLAERRVEHPRRDFGLYLDCRWAPTWPAAVIDWPDYGLPPHDWEAIVSIREAFHRAQGGQSVEVGCVGGGMSANLLYGFEPFNLQNLSSFPGTWRVECPHTSVTSGGDCDAPHHRALRHPCPRLLRGAAHCRGAAAGEDPEGRRAVGGIPTGNGLFAPPP
jgi:hypothetical protein